ncbi:MAG: hypothetical protein EP330_20045 [Deltaproteobacteria bacterium]|nr:MAG: hypothetical protein EP330_20045 [Deltaproteobacteria bacterium]
MRILALLVLLAGCGNAPRIDNCGGDDECRNGEYCAAPNDPAVCGIPPQEACGGDSDCTEGSCHAIFDSCSPDQVGSTCDAACVLDDDCGSGFECGPTGGCQPVSCVDDPSVCAAHEVCEADQVIQSGAPHAMFDGCVQPTCDTDDDCSGACVDGLCHSGPGVCVPDQAVP